jgi:hypothetical protein
MTEKCMAEKWIIQTQLRDGVFARLENAPLKFDGAESKTPAEL